MSVTTDGPGWRRRDVAPVYEDQETVIRRVVREELAPLHELLLQLSPQPGRQVGEVLAGTE